MNNRLVTVTFLLISTVILFHVLVIAKNFLMPFIIAIFLWHLLNTLASYIKSAYMIGRYLPYSLCLMAAVVILGWVLFQLGSILTNNVNEVIVNAPRYQEKLKAILTSIDDTFHIKALVYVNDVIQNFSLKNILVNIYSTFTSITSNALLIALYVGFLFLEQQVMRLKLEALFPQKKHLTLATNIISQIVADTQTYIGIKSAVSLTTAISCWLIMKYLALDFAEFWALLIFFLNFIPNIGPIIATAFPALLALIQFQDSWLPFTVITGGIVAIQFIIGNLIEPKFLGNSLNLSPLVILLSLGIWGELWGILGMFLSVPITVMVMIVFAHFDKTKGIAILMSQTGSVKAIE